MVILKARGFLGYRGGDRFELIGPRRPRRILRRQRDPGDRALTPSSGRPA
jgi:hypothetical protein